MNNRWIFPTLSIVTLNTWVLGNYWWAAILFILLWLRIITLQQPKVFVITLMLNLCFGLFFLNFKAQQAQQQRMMQHQEGQNISLVTTVWTDELIVDGNQLRVVATVPKTEQKLLVTAIIPNETTKNQLLQAHGTVQLTLQGQLMAMTPATNLGQFNALYYYSLQQIIGRLGKAKVTNVTKISTHGVEGYIHELRQPVLSYFEALPKYVRFYGETLILGYARPDFYQENQGIQTLGLLHLFSISGFQVTMFVTMIIWILAKLRVPKELIAIGLIFLLPAYYIFSGSIPSLIRPILLGIIGQLLIISRQRLPSIDILSLSLLGGLYFEPGILQMLGGQLSYLLALALICAQHLKFWQEVLMMNIVMLPLLLNATYQWNVIALLANFIFIPIFTYLVVPLTVISVCSYTVLPLLTNGVDTLLLVLNRTITYLATLPGNIIFGQLNVMLAVVATLITLYLMQNFTAKRWWFFLSVLYCIGYFAIQLPINGAVTFVDIGQGDSILITTPFKRQVTLIDTGWRLAFGNQASWQKTTKKAKSNAELFLLPYILQQGISQIDQLILTHADADHSGDVAEVLKNVHVRYLYVGHGLENYPKYQNLAKQYHVQIRPLQAGMKVGGTNLQVLWPEQLSAGKNEDSVVTIGQYGKLAFLLMGDLDRTHELSIAQRYPNLHADVIKLGHHGSKTSSHPAFLQQIKPKLAIISAGRNNRYHHPHEETLATLATLKIKYLNTAHDGMIKYEWSLFGDRWWKMNK